METLPESASDALRAIANMQVEKDTDKGEVLALCMSIARIELEKWGKEVKLWNMRQ